MCECVCVCACVCKHVCVNYAAAFLLLQQKEEEGEQQQEQGGWWCLPHLSCVLFLSVSLFSFSVLMPRFALIPLTTQPHFVFSLRPKNTNKQNRNGERERERATTTNLTGNTLCGGKLMNYNAVVNTLRAVFYLSLNPLSLPHSLSRLFTIYYTLNSPLSSLKPT